MKMSFEEYLIDNIGDDYIVANDQKAFRCPFCIKNHDYKLYVNTSGGQRDGLWDCKRCGRVGNPVGFVMEYEDVNFKQAKDILESYGIESNEFFRQAKEQGLTDEEALYLMLMEPESSTEEGIVKTPPPLPKGFKLIADNLDKWEVVPFLDYLINKRNIGAENIPLHNIGYVTKGSFETSTGKTVTLINHLVFLTHDFEGNYMYWNTRSIDPNPYLKSINASGKETEYTRGDSIFNFNLASKLPRIVLTEGVFDALTVGPEGVSGFGKQYTETQLRLILDNIEPHQELYILLDRDAITVKNAQGESTTIKMAERLYSEHEETYIVIPETEEDPNDLGKERVWDLINNKAIKASPEGRLLVGML